jgi:hypothetical protein
MAEKGVRITRSDKTFKLLTCQPFANVQCHRTGILPLEKTEQKGPLPTG